MKNKSERAILYFSKNFRKKINLDEVAKISGISPFYFHRKFVEENKCTPFAYLEKIRMQHATHIMGLFFDMSLIEVAFECGYSSPGIFSRAFKKYYGIAPSKYKSINIDVAEKYHQKKSEPIQIQYLSKKIITVKKVPLIEKELNIAFQQLVNKDNLRSTIYGFYLDVPFHIPPDECRYFIGSESAISDKNASTLTIDSGYYTSIIVQGGFDQLEEKMVVLNNQIKNKGYVIDSLQGFEKVMSFNKTTPFNYMLSQREIFVKIKRE